MNEFAFLFSMILFGIIFAVLLIEGVIFIGLYIYRRYFSPEIPETPPQPAPDPTKIVSNTQAVWDLIDQLIAYETAAVIEKTAPLERKYDVTRADKDIQLIATNVFEALNQTVLSDEEFRANLLVTNEWLVKRIVTVASRNFIRQITEYNNSL